jgi:hypothetical protein
MVMVCVLGDQPSGVGTVVADKPPPRPTLLVEHAGEPPGVLMVDFGHVSERTGLAPNYGAARCLVTFDPTQKLGPEIWHAERTVLLTHFPPILPSFGRCKETAR